jgi:integrase
VQAFRAFAQAGAWGPFSRSNVRRAFRLAVSKVETKHPSWKLDGVRPYDLRHPFATAVYRVTGDLDVTRRLLGHSSSRTTERYAAGALVEVERQAVKKVSKGM